MKTIINDVVIDTNELSKRRIEDSELWHNGFHPISPAHLIESLLSAKEELSFSNYDCANFDRLAEVLMRYCEEHHISIV